MPIKKIIRKGKVGYKFGAEGKAYFGRVAREKARKQGAAIEISKLSRLKRIRN